MAVGFSISRSAAAWRNPGRKGYRRFAAIGADDERAKIRWKSYLTALTELGVADVASIITPAPANLWMGRDGLSRLLADGFIHGAIFCSSNCLAHGVLVEAQARGLSVPGDVAVVGFGDLDFAAFTVPALTTVRIDRFAIGRLAAEALLSRLAGEPVGEKVVDVGFQIVERGST